MATNQPLTNLSRVFFGKCKDHSKSIRSQGAFLSNKTICVKSISGLTVWLLCLGRLEGSTLTAGPREAGPGEGSRPGRVGLRERVGGSSWWRPMQRRALGSNTNSGSWLGAVAPGEKRQANRATSEGQGGKRPRLLRPAGEPLWRGSPGVVPRSCGQRGLCGWIYMISFPSWRRRAAPGAAGRAGSGGYRRRGWGR
jgi:hypothetical protein